MKEYKKIKCLGEQLESELNKFAKEGFVIRNNWAFLERDSEIFVIIMEREVGKEDK